MFSFGKNWRDFSRCALTEDGVTRARHDFHALFSNAPLNGRRFLDVGFGQGLSLFLAAESGAQAKGIDIDPVNLEAIQLTARFFPHVTAPQFEQASILDDE